MMIMAFCGRMRAVKFVRDTMEILGVGGMLGRSGQVMAGHNIPGAHRSMILRKIGTDQMTSSFQSSWQVFSFFIGLAWTRRSGAMRSLPFVDSLARRPWGEPTVVR